MERVYRAIGQALAAAVVAALATGALGLLVLSARFLARAVRG